MTNDIARKILIVDDEPDILEFLSYNFSKNGFAVITAANGVEGVERAVKGIPDVIVSDILMPYKDGIQMCKEMRANEMLRSVPIIFLTAVNDDYKVLHAMSAGADHFISKPIHFNALHAMVNEIVETKKPDRILLIH